MGLLPVLQPHLVHFHDYGSPTADFVRSAACAAQRMYALKRVATEVDLQRMDNQLTESAQPTRGPADSMQLLVNVAKATNLQQHGRVGIV